MRSLRDQNVGPAFQHFFPASHRRSAGVSYQMRYLPGSLSVKFSSEQVSEPSAKQRSSTLKLTRAGAGAEKMLSLRWP